MIDEKIKKIKLEIEMLRTREERAVNCVYGPGKEGYGHKCEGCEDEKRTCIYVIENIDGSTVDYVMNVTENSEMIKFLENILKESMEYFKGEEK
jgi:hypothetical protein